MRILSFKIQKFRRKLIFYEFLSILNFLQANNNLYPTFTSSSVVNESFMWIDRLEMDGSSLLCSLCLLPRKLAMPRLSVCLLLSAVYVYLSIYTYPIILSWIHLPKYLLASVICIYLLTYIPSKKNRHWKCRFSTHFFLHLYKLRIIDYLFLEFQNKDIKQNYE